MSDDEEFYSADEHEDGDHHHHHDHHDHHVSKQSPSEPHIETKENSTEILRTSEEAIKQASQKNKNNISKQSYAQNIAGFMLCAGAPPPSASHSHAELQRYMQASSSENDLTAATLSSNKLNLSPLKTEQEAAEDSSKIETLTSFNGNNSPTSPNSQSKSPVMVTNLDVPTYLDLSDNDGFRYTTYRISIGRSDGKISHIFKRFNEIYDMNFDILSNHVLQPNNHKKLKAYYFPHKSMLNTFASHTLERRRTGFAGFLKLLLEIVQSGDHGCVPHLATLLSINQKMLTGIDQKTTESESTPTPKSDKNK